MKKLLLLIAAIMFFSIAVNAQSNRLNLDKTTWRPADNPTQIAQFAQSGNEGRAPIAFSLGESHFGAGRWISPTQLIGIQTMHAGGGCTVNMYLVFTVKTDDLIDLTYEFLEGKCGWNKGAKGSTTLTRVRN